MKTHVLSNRPVQGRTVFLTGLLALLVLGGAAIAFTRWGDRRQSPRDATNASHSIADTDPEPNGDTLERVSEPEPRLEQPAAVRVAAREGTGADGATSEADPEDSPVPELPPPVAAAKDPNHERGIDGDGMATPTADVVASAPAEAPRPD